MPINAKVANKYTKLIAKLNPNLSDFDKKIILKSLQRMYDLGLADGHANYIVTCSNS